MASKIRDLSYKFNFVENLGRASLGVLLGCGHLRSCWDVIVDRFVDNGGTGDTVTNPNDSGWQKGGRLSSFA